MVSSIKVFSIRSVRCDQKLCFFLHVLIWLALCCNAPRPTKRTQVRDFHHHTLRIVRIEWRIRQEGIEQCEVEASATARPERSAATERHLAHSSGRKMGARWYTSTCCDKVQRQSIMCHGGKPYMPVSRQRGVRNPKA